MAIEFKLPEVSEGVTSVDIAEVKVAEGDVIAAGAVICEVETDKAVAEISCPHAGRITKVLVKTGQSVPIGHVLVLIEADSPAANNTASEPPAPKKAAVESVAPAAPATKPVTAASQPASAAPGGGETTIAFRLPEVSEGVKTVDVAVVNVKVGDVIAAGAAVCEVETDKAVAEINCPHAGTITAVHVKPGTTIPIGEVLVDIRTTSGGGVAAPAASAPAPSAAIAATTTTAEAASPASPAVSPVATTGAGASVGKTADNRPPAPAGPATRRLARKLGVDLYQVKGSAAGGRITIEDIEAYVRERLKQPTLPSAASAPGFGIVAAAPLPDFSKFGPIEKQPMNKIFRVAAASLHAAWVTIPHVTQHDLADITELEAARKRYVKSNPNAPKITMTAIMIKAVVGALKAFPNVNSSVDMQSGEMIIKHYYHIGVAVDTPNGLVVPVIRNCDQKNVLQVAAELGEIATRARDRKLKTEDMQGATFTITNLGGIGGTAFTPIVNYPEVAILGLSRGITQLVLEEGQVTERLMLPLSLSYDHRAINGADAARFIVKLSSSLSNFFELF
jgi:pyruvate dehydrogenase E2 component (dihydrolipoamide acetyltransferase)